MAMNLQQTDLSNFDKRWSDAHFVSFLFYYYCTKYQGGAASRRGKKRTLEDLFKPPIDIIFKGDLQTARDSATSAKKWLLVNIQDAVEFQCQVLNRDVWSNEAVKSILRQGPLKKWKEHSQVLYLLKIYSRGGGLLLHPGAGWGLMFWTMSFYNPKKFISRSFL